MSILAVISPRDVGHWANENQGVLAIVIFALPVLWLAYTRVVRIISGRPARLAIADEFAHAEKLKKELEQRTEWEPVWESYGEFLIRDIDGRLPYTEETHSRRVARHSIVVLTAIHKEHLEFTSGSNFGRYIMQIGDSWYFADEGETGAVFVEYVFWVNYRDIVSMRWETDDYWEWPQVCCRFVERDKFPFTRRFFGERMKGLPRPFYREVCLVAKVTERPEGLRSRSGETNDH